MSDKVVNEEPEEFVIYQNDFCDSDIWKQICESVGVDYEKDKLTLKYVEAEVSETQWGEG